jgi:hypothetical protein
MHLGLIALIFVLVNVMGDPAAVLRAAALLLLFWAVSKYQDRSTPSSGAPSTSALTQ